MAILTAASSNAPQPAARIQAWLLYGLADFRHRGAEAFRGDGPPDDARSWRRIAPRIAVFGGLVLLGAFWGSVVAVGGLNALYLCAAMIGCAFILYDFRIGVVLLIVLMPVSSSYIFPHAMLGITGLNPLNLLLVATLGSCLLQGLRGSSFSRFFIPRPLLWLYVVPFLLAGAVGSRHVGDIAPAFFIFDKITFDSTAGYVRNVVVKPLLLVVFALLVGAAVAKSEKPEKFLVPMLVSIWVIGSILIVAVAQSGFALSQLASHSSRALLSVTLGMNMNQLGPLYAVAYALLLFTWAESKEQTSLRVVLLASMGLVVVALTLTFSRGAYVGFIVVNVLFLLWRRNANALIFLGLLAAASLFLLPDAVYDRVTEGFGEGLNTISSERIERIWLPLLPDVLRSPIYGNGLGSIFWSEAMRMGAGVTTALTGQAHNAYLETILNMGIAGLLLVCAYFVHVWKGFRALSVNPAVSLTERGFHQGAAAGLVGFLVTGMTSGYLTPATEQVFLWLAIGMMYGQRARTATP